MAGTLPKYLKEVWRRVCSRHMQKLCIRGLLVFIAMIVLIVDTRTAKVLGPANIFALALAVVIPPFFPVSLHILVTLAFMILLLSCWAWANLITSAANAVRSTALLAQQVMAAESSFIPGLPIELQNAVFVFNGHFLDPRASAVTGILLFVSTWMYGLLLAHYPALTVILYFSLTLLSSGASVNPLIPYPIYTMSLTYLISSACYFALCIVAYIFIFPSSFNASWLVQVRHDVLGPVVRFLDSNTDVQHESEQTPHVRMRAHTSEVSITNVKTAMSNLELFKFTFKTELSVHRLSPNEHLEMMHLFGRVVERIGELEAAQEAVNAVCRLPRNASADKHEAGKERLPSPSPDVIQTVNTASDNLRVAVQIALMDIDEWMKECNMDSWGDVLQGLITGIKYTAVMKKHRDAARKKAHYRRVRVEISRSSLRAATSNFKKGDLKAILRVVRGQDQTGELDVKEQAGLQDKDTLVMLAYLNTLNQLGKTVLDFLAFLIRVETMEPYPKLRLPPALLTLFRANPAPADATALHQDINQDIESQPDSPSSLREKEKHREEPSSSGVESQIASSSDHSDGTRYRPPSHVVFSSTIPLPECPSPSPAPSQPLNAIPGPASVIPPSPKIKKRKTLRRNGFWAWLSSNEMILGLRVAIVSVALWIPVVCRNTTGLSVRNYGLLALILGQSYVMLYAGEQVFYFLVRFSGTLTGIFLTAACWYISAGGDGRGNGYILVVVTTIFMLPSFFVVASGSHRYTVIFSVSAAATIATMTALIWADVRKAPSGGSPARIVFDDLWKRIVLDLIGATGAFVVMMFPKPITMRSKFHDSLSSILTRLSEVLHITPGESTESEIEVIKRLLNEFSEFNHYLMCMRFDPRVKSVPLQLYRDIQQATRILLLASGQYLHNVQLIESGLRSEVHNRLTMVPNILSACNEELRDSSGSATMTDIAPLGFSTSNDSGIIEVPANLSNTQSIIFASLVLNVHEIVTTSIQLTTSISQLKSGERS